MLKSRTIRAKTPSSPHTRAKRDERSAAPDLAILAEAALEDAAWPPAHAAWLVSTTLRESERLGHAVRGQKLPGGCIYERDRVRKGRANEKKRWAKVQKFRLFFPARAKGCNDRGKRPLHNHANTVVYETLLEVF